MGGMFEVMSREIPGDFWLIVDGSSTDLLKDTRKRAGTCYLGKNRADSVSSGSSACHLFIQQVCGVWKKL
jgi:hypothetical protein